MDKRMTYTAPQARLVRRRVRSGDERFVLADGEPDVKTIAMSVGLTPDVVTWILANPPADPFIAELEARQEAQAGAETPTITNERPPRGQRKTA